MGFCLLFEVISSTLAFQAVFQTLRGSGLTNHPALAGPGLLITVIFLPALCTAGLVTHSLKSRGKAILILRHAN